VFAELTKEIANMFEGAGAMNYVEYTVYSETHGPMSVLIQRQEGETPAQQNVVLRKRIAALEAEIQQEREG
jgi:cell division protein FtsB